MSSSNSSAAPPPSPTSHSEQIHNRIAAAVKSVLPSTESCLVGSVSKHTLRDTISFSNLNAMHGHVKAEAKESPQCDFIAASGQRLVYSSRFGTLQPSAAVTALTTGRKRQRDAEATQENTALTSAEEVRRRVTSAEGMKNEDAARISSALYGVLTSLKGPSGEEVVQSYAVFVKQISQFGYTGPIIVLALRCTSGVPIPVSTLKRALGTCWNDGIVTVQRTYAPLGLEEKDLPLSEEGNVAAQMGNAPLLIAATAGRPSLEKKKNSESEPTPLSTNKTVVSADNSPKK